MACGKKFIYWTSYMCSLKDEGWIIFTMSTVCQAKCFQTHRVGFQQRNKQIVIEFHFLLNIRQSNDQFHWLTFSFIFSFELFSYFTLSLNKFFWQYSFFHLFRCLFVVFSFFWRLCFYLYLSYISWGFFEKTLLWIYSKLQ